MNILLAENVAINTDWVISDIPNQEASRVTDGDKRETSCVILSGSDSRLQVDTGSLHVIKTINVILKEGMCTISTDQPDKINDIYYFQRVCVICSIVVSHSMWKTEFAFNEKYACQLYQSDSM